MLWGRLVGKGVRVLDGWLFPLWQSLDVEVETGAVLVELDAGAFEFRGI